jgi:hypothetical protein
MDDLTAGEVLPHVSAAHIRRTAPPIQALGGTAEYCASGNEGAEPVDVLFPKFWRLLCVES